MFSGCKLLGFQPKEVQISELRVGLQICVTHSLLFFLSSDLHVCGVCIFEHVCVCGCQTTQEVKIGQKRFCVNVLSSRHPFPSVCSANLPSLPLGQLRYLQGGRQRYCRSKDDGVFQNCTCFREHAILASGAPCLGACWGALSVGNGEGVERVRKETLYSSAIIGPSVFLTLSPGGPPQVKGGWGQSL